MHHDWFLVLRLKCGSTEAFERIYRKYRRYLLKIATAILDDTAAAEDVVHDVFLRFAQSMRTIETNGSLKSYLRVCVVNDIRNRARDGKVRSYIELSDAPPIADKQNSADQWIILNEQSMQISCALAQLPLEQREAIVLHVYGEMKFREIAKLQAVSSKTIQSRYRYGLGKLRRLLDNEVCNEEK